MVETFVQESARGLYRWERGEGWPESRGPNSLCQFDEGDAITIDPFKGFDYGDGPEWLWPVYGTFREYVTDDIARVYIPPAGEDGPSTWFHEGEGEYLIHEGYLTPQ